MFKNIRQPAVAGQFYPIEPDSLKKQIVKYLAEAIKPATIVPPASAKDAEVREILVPHAGYDYSGQVAAYAYKKIKDKKINNVVIISNSHSAYFDGAAIDSSAAWQTPLGVIEVNRELAGKLAQTGRRIKLNSQAHSLEHALEVQLPFLQTVLKPGFKIVPILFGNLHDDSYKELAKALWDSLSSDDLVVLSSDMSHYPTYEAANKIDRLTLEKIKSGDVAQLEEYVKQTEDEHIPNEHVLLCGVDAVKAGMELAAIAGWQNGEILKYANSGDTPVTVDKKRVVGYGALIFGKTGNKRLDAENKKTEAINGNTDNIDLDILSKVIRTEQIPNYKSQTNFYSQKQADGQDFSGEQRRRLLDIAKISVENSVKNASLTEFAINDEKLNQKRGAFVTLRKKDRLRGCIGQIVPSDKPLWQVVRDMAVAAATADGRFLPVGAAELNEIDYEISVLSVPEKISDWRTIELGKHGVIIRQGYASGVFLPQVAEETGWGKEEFLAQLCRQKAGLSPRCYLDKTVELEVFTAEVFKS